MGVYNFIPKRKPKNFKSDVGDTFKVFPLCYSNRLSDEDFRYYGHCGDGGLSDYTSRDMWKHEMRLAARHRAVALAWEDDFTAENIPLVTIVGDDCWNLTGKWQPREDEPVYRFNKGDVSTIFSSHYPRRTYDYKDIPCFWYDTEHPGDEVGVFARSNGKWVIIPK